MTVRQTGVLVKRFTIDGRRVRSFDEFVEATNMGFVELVGGKWNGNLDAFNDYLSWPEEEEYELELLDAASCVLSQANCSASIALLSSAKKSTPPR